ncbi:GNAT family N-acetyltransferase [Streptosporangiaceae bacterium NEAU-GS5]|nr:GNAT family N-acetyltransferase [Streptosporangiaceae bacterium NEAU-GS5]
MYPIRPFSEDEWDAFCVVLSEAFNQEWSPVQADRFKQHVEFDRTLAVYDGDQIIGGTGVFSFSMTVPGGPIPVGGVTAVAVLPSHRRRGVLRTMMTRQLGDIRERGEAVAALYASEAGIYGRFGYGRAGDNLFFRIPKHGSAFRPDAPADPTLRIRVARPAEARLDFVKVFDSLRTTRPGYYDRTTSRWDSRLADEEADRGGDGPLRSLVAYDDNGPRGYALFRVRSRFTDHDIPDGEVQLYELFATDPAAYAGLWRGVLDRDLCSGLYAWNRAVDDPLIHLLAEPRYLNAGWLDELWIRVVDVERALTQRAYSAPAEVVIEVEDQICPWNEGRYRLVTAKGTCERTEDSPDLTLPVQVLGAAYLGGRSLMAYRDAGIVREHREGALRELSAAMEWDPKPWCGLVF